MRPPLLREADGHAVDRMRHIHITTFYTSLRGSVNVPGALPISFLDLLFRARIMQMTGDLRLFNLGTAES